MARIQITGGSFQTPSGDPVANGYLRMWLSHDSQESAGPSEVAAGLDVHVPLDADGNISGTVEVWSNDDLNPDGSYYNVDLHTSTGMKAWKAPQRWTIPNDTNPYDVGNQVPNVPPQ